VYRPCHGGFEIAIGEQIDRLSRALTRRLPKGKPTAGETPERTALREVEEETGLVASVVAPLLDVHYTYGGSEAPVRKTVHFFLMRWQHGEARPADGEMERVYWCPIEEAATLLTFETERSAVASARERLAAGTLS
jgi:8-oxo-dGTP pyrophosphatase MutT (NUDIX family)